jgi:nitroreductase
MTVLKTVPLAFAGLPESDMLGRARDFRALMARRRTVRDFSNRPVPRELIEQAVMTAATAPSGANQQPWTFVCIGDQAIKQRIRVAPLGTDADKPFLEIAPWLIVIFAQRYGLKADGSRRKHYYVPESVGIATGLLIASLHNAGLAALTHTPSPMGFLNEICGRPEHEKAVILLVAGYPAENAEVPDIRRKEADELIVWKE